MPLALKDKSAAQQLDLPVTEFHRLVEAGVLPRPFKIGNNVRWRYEDIEAIVSGKAAKPSEDIE